jgi:hypothetical protein
LVNTRDPESSLYWAERRVLEIQAKLHRWRIEQLEAEVGELGRQLG